MEREALIELSERWIRAGWQEGNADALDDFHTVDFVDHSPSGRDSSLQGFKSGVRELYSAFPDFHAAIEDMVVEEQTGRVAIRWSATGTHRGMFEGMPPTHRRITFTGIEIVVIDQGRIRERWGEWNGLELIRRLRDGV